MYIVSLKVLNQRSLRRPGVQMLLPFLILVAVCNQDLLHLPLPRVVCSRKALTLPALFMHVSRRFLYQHLIRGVLLLLDLGAVPRRPS